jgi:hypothetical protein
MNKSAYRLSLGVIIVLIGLGAGICEAGCPGRIGGGKRCIKPPATRPCPPKSKPCPPKPTPPKPTPPKPPCSLVAH